MQKLSKIKTVGGVNLRIVLANILGAIIYLWFSVPLWAPPELINEPGAGAGDPLIWGLTALPTFVIFFLLNIAWLLWAIKVYFVRRTWPVKIIYLVVPVIWVVVLYIDFSHHWSL